MGLLFIQILITLRGILTHPSVTHARSPWSTAYTIVPCVYVSSPSPTAPLPGQTTNQSSLTYRTLKMGFSVKASIICSEWNSSAPREPKRVPHGDQLKPAIPTLWKPCTLLRICFVTTSHIATCFWSVVGSTDPIALYKWVQSKTKGVKSVCCVVFGRRRSGSEVKNFRLP